MPHSAASLPTCASKNRRSEAAESRSTSSPRPLSLAGEQVWPFEVQPMRRTVHAPDGTSQSSVPSAPIFAVRSTIRALSTAAADGSTVYASYADDADQEEYGRWKIAGKIKCTGKKASDGGFLLNGSEYVGTNMSIDVVTKYCDFTIKVTGIEISKAEEPAK